MRFFLSSMDPPVPFAPGDRMSSAPYALIMLLLSVLTDSGMTSVSLYPFAADIIARAMPVLPEVASKREAFLSSLPALSAYSNM